MGGLIDTDTGLTFGDGLIWLDGGLGGPGLGNETTAQELLWGGDFLKWGALQLVWGDEP